jgi:hypothetical protein
MIVLSIMSVESCGAVCCSGAVGKEAVFCGLTHAGAVTVRFLTDAFVDTKSDT